MPETKKPNPYVGELSLASPQILHPYKESGRSHRVDSQYIRDLIQLGMYIDNPNGKKEITDLITNIEENRRRGKTKEAEKFWNIYLEKYDHGSLQVIDDVLSSGQARKEFQSGFGFDVDFYPSKPSLTHVQERVGGVFKQTDPKLVVNSVIVKSFLSDSRDRIKSLFEYLQEQDQHNFSSITKMIFLALMEGEVRHAILDPINRALKLRSDEKTTTQDLSEDLEGKKDFFKRIALSSEGKLGAEYLRGYHRLVEAHLWKLAIENFGEDYETAILAVRGIAYRKSNEYRAEVSRDMIKALVNKNPEEARKIMIDDVLRHGEKTYDQRYWLSIGVNQEMRDWFRQAKHKNEVADRVLSFEKAIEIQKVWQALGINPSVRTEGDNLFQAQGEELRLVDIRDGYVTFEKDEGVFDISLRRYITQTIRLRYTYGQLLNTMASQNYWKKEGETEPAHSRVTVILLRPKMDPGEIIR